MVDCLEALQQCSLIGLEDSPQLLRRSMLSSANQATANGPVSQQLDFATAGCAETVGRRQAALQQGDAAAGSQPVYAVANAVAAAAGGKSTSTWLGCSLPLLASDSPAIAGTKPPRSRFRRAITAAAPGAEAAAQQRAALNGAAAGCTADSAAAGGMDAPAAEASCQLVNSPPNSKKDGMPLGSCARGVSDTDSTADCDPAAAAAAGNTEPGPQPKQQWELLQQLLDDSSCSSLSCLPAALSQQQSPAPAAAAAASPPAAAGGGRSSLWNSPDAAAARELTRSIGSDITGFKGFWSATPGAHSAAAFSPAPMGHPGAADAYLRDSDSERPSQTPCAYDPDAAAAAAGEGAVPAAGKLAAARAKRNTELMMLLSLDDSMVLGRASCDDGDDNAQHQCSSPIPEGTPSAEQQTPAGAGPEADTHSGDIASPDAAPAPQMLLQQDWAAAGPQGLSSRYTADCWPSPDGSPGVLLSSPNLQEGTAAAAADSAPATASRFAPGSPAAGTAPVDGCARDSGEAEPGSRAAALRALRQPNALECSPIRGLTLWGDHSIPDAAQHLAAAAAAEAAGSDSPGWEQPAQQQGAADNSSSPGASASRAASQYQQLQRLLTSSTSSSEDWQDADPECAAPEMHGHLPADEMLGPQQQQDQSDDLQQQEHWSPQQHVGSQQQQQQHRELASSITSALQARSPGLKVCVGDTGDAAAGPADGRLGSGTGPGSSSSPSYYTPADTPQSEQPAAHLPPPASPGLLLLQAQQEQEQQAQLEQKLDQEEQPQQEEEPMQLGQQTEQLHKAQGPYGSPVPLVPSPPPGSPTAAHNSNPLGTPGSAQGRPSPLRLRSMVFGGAGSPLQACAASPRAVTSAAASPRGAAAEAAASPGAVALAAASPRGAAPAAAGAGSSAGTPVSARGRMSPLQLRASPAESMDSFYGAAAGEPYASIAVEGSLGRVIPAGDPVRRSLTWQAYDGLGSLLDGETPPTPGSVLCKKAWGSAAGTGSDTAVSSAVQSSGGAAAQAAAAATAGDAGAVSAAVAAASAPADLASLVSVLQQRLREAELRCTQQHMSVNEARQLVLQKELEVERLRVGLVKSEQEGTGCLEALEAALDIITTTEAPVEHTAPASAAAHAAAVSAAAAACGSSEEADLQQRCQVLLEHNTELQSTLAEAGQQLDLFESQLQQLGADKAAVQQQLTALQAQLAQQQADSEAFLQSELDEQQQQHEEEVGQLHERLQELREQAQGLQDAAAAAKAAAEQSRAKVASLQQQLTASEQHAQGLAQQLEQLQAVLRGQESESAASSEQLSRQVAQLLAAQQELQQANARLLEAEAEYASNQLALGCRNQELSKQLQEAVSNNKQLGESNKQLQAQNASLSQMLQSLRANTAANSAATAAAAAAAMAGGATPTSSTAQSRPAGSAPATSAVASGMEGPTPMRRRMASVNAQLERRVQDLLQQKQALAAQVEQLQQQLGQQGPAAAADTGLTEQQAAAMDELRQRVEHLTGCNDELMQQLEELDWALEQLQGEQVDLQGRLSDLEQEREQLLSHVQQLQQQAESADPAGTAADGFSAGAAALQQLQEERDRLAADCEQLQERLAHAQQQLSELQEQQDADYNNTALFERCKELKSQVQHLQQQLQQRDAHAARASADGLRCSAEQQQEEDLFCLRQELQQLQHQQARQEEQHRVQEQQLTSKCEQLSGDLAAAQQQLAALQSQLDSAVSDKEEAAAECRKLQQASSDAEAARAAAQEALAGLKDRNRSLVDQLVQMQLATPARTPVHRAVGADTAEAAAQTTLEGRAAGQPGSAAEGQRPSKRRWTLDAGVQVELGGTDAEQATAVQQLLLLQAQAQLHEMEEQTRQAAQRHVESKQRIAQLQSSLTQQEAALQAAEQQLREAKQTQGRESASLQRENEQLVRQLADTRVQLQVLQTANTHLDARVQQQQKDLQQHAAAAKDAQLKVQELTHQQHLDRLQVAAVTAELQACKDHRQQLMAAQQQEAQAVAALQQRLHQAQQDGQKAAAAAVATSRAAYAALEERLGQEVQARKEEVEQLMTQKTTLLMELQQTKATVDCLEDSVRRMGQHNAHLVQQIKGTLSATGSTSTGMTAALAAAGACAGAAVQTPTSATPAGAGATASSKFDSEPDQLTDSAAAATAAAAATVSPGTIHSIITAATKVNAKNKMLKRQLQLALQARPA